MELELHQLTLRYERLRKRRPRAERALLVSLTEIGQQLPVVVVSEAERFVLIDGYKRVRALKRLARDTVHGTCWEVAEVEALLLERGLRCASEDALDQAWLLAELRNAASVVGGTGAALRAQQELGERPSRADASPAGADPGERARRHFGRPRGDEVFGAVGARQRGGGHALAAAITPLKPTSREVGALYAGWQRAPSAPAS